MNKTCNPLRLLKFLVERNCMPWMGVMNKKNKNLYPKTVLSFIALSTWWHKTSDAGLRPMNLKGISVDIKIWLFFYLKAVSKKTYLTHVRARYAAKHSVFSDAYHCRNEKDIRNLHVEIQVNEIWRRIFKRYSHLKSTPTQSDNWFKMFVLRTWMCVFF